MHLICSACSWWLYVPALVVYRGGGHISLAHSYFISDMKLVSPSSSPLHLLPKVANERVALLLCVLEVPESNLGSETCYPV